MRVRRLPVFIVVDTSGSMRGEPMEAVRQGVQNLVSAVRADPHAEEITFISMISYAAEARVMCPLTAARDFVAPELSAPTPSPSMLGEALSLMCDECQSLVRRSTLDGRTGDWPPLLFVLTDGDTSDPATLDEVIPRLRSMQFAKVVGCLAGTDTTLHNLRAICTDIVALDTLDLASFQALFVWG